MTKRRSETEQQVADLLITAKESLNLTAAFLTRMDGLTQHLEVVESSVPFLFHEGATMTQATTLCQAIWDGKLPAVIPDVRKFPVAMALPSARLPRIRSYVSVPVVLADGTRYGTFCAAGLTTDKALTKRDKSLMDVLARAAAVLIEPGVRERNRHSAITRRLAPVIAGRGPVVLLQPIVELSSGARVGAEALSRFPQEWNKAPDICFGEAHSVGLGHQLELLALERAAEHLDRVPGYISMNVSPATALTQEFSSLLDLFVLPRVLLELSEHDPVEDYDALTRTLAPLRERGMRLAIDDVGAGFSSLRHIVLTSPEVIKLDRSLVHGLAADPVLRTLVAALVEFTRGFDAEIVAEGVETHVDAEALLSLGVDFGQGWYFGRPTLPENLDEPRAPLVTPRAVPRARSL